MTVCSTTSSYVFSTRMNLAKSSKISSWNRDSSCRPGRAWGQREGGQGCGSGSGRWAAGSGRRAAGGSGGLLTDLQVGASFLSRNGMVICSSASRKKRFRTVLLS